MARSSASSLQKERGRPVRMGVSFFCTDRYIILLTWEVQKHICAKRYRYRGDHPMTLTHLAQAAFPDFCAWNGAPAPTPTVEKPAARCRSPKIPFVVP